jgi:hippurate hydrolase
MKDFISLRQELHATPEASGAERQTAARLMRLWGYALAEGVGGYGVVGVLQKGRGTRSLGLRADIDALPILEASGLAFASQSPGLMQACGHTAILLAAAHRLADLPFDGRLVLIFQPAEEIGAGAKAMIADGLFTRFPVDETYGLHSWPRGNGAFS